MSGFAALGMDRPDKDRAAGPEARSEAEPAAELGNQALQALLAGGLRPRLDVGGADDPEEREADRLADQALSGRAAPCACGSPSCATCGAAKVRRKADSAAGPPTAVAAGFGNRAGRPLDAATRGHFEPCFGADFSEVRVHDDPATHRFARGIGARAFAVGNDIGFAEGRHSPGTAGGRSLIAHELAHVALGHGAIRRDDEKKADPAAAPAAPAKTAEPPAGFDPCAVDVPSLDNRQLLQHFQIAEGYVGKLDKAKRKGEERYYDYRNLRNRLIDERSARAKNGHAWLNAELSDIPETLYGLKTGEIGPVISVTSIPGSTLVGKQAVGGLIITQGQFDAMLARENIPHVDAAEYFGKQDPNAPQQPLEIAVPPKEQPRTVDYSAFPFVQPPGPYDPSGLIHPSGMFGVPARPPVSFSNQFLWQHGFTDPVVWGGSTSYSPEALEGYRTRWRGEVGEAMFRGVNPETAATVIDLNTYQKNFTLFDYMDPRMSPPELGSIKTQMPDAPGDAASLEAYLEAHRQLFGNEKPSKRTEALDLLKTHVDPTMTQDQMLRQTVWRVNPDLVARARAAQLASIQLKPKNFNAILSVKLQDKPIELTLKDRTKKTYSDIADLHADWDAKKMSEAKYRGAITELAMQCQNQIQPGVGTAEGDFRPLLEIRQPHDLAGAREFRATPGTDAGKRATADLQRAYYERLATPEYMQGMRYGLRPGMRSASKGGAAFGVGTAAVLDLYPMYRDWDKDPYAGRRYAFNVALSGGGGAAQGSAEYLTQHYITEGGLRWAAARAQAGKSVAPIAGGAPAARLAGSTILGGVFSAGITMGGMYMDEAYFGADYSKIDYEAKGARAFVTGSISAGAGALATGFVTAKLVGAGGAGICSVVPGAGTVTCGAVGLGVGFLVGVGVYYVTDWIAGDAIENKARDLLGEQGCKK